MSALTVGWWWFPFSSPIKDTRKFPFIVALPATPFDVSRKTKANFTWTFSVYFRRNRVV